MKQFVGYAALALGVVSALDPIEIKGSKFFNKSSGEQFYFKGVAYQPEKGDPNPGNADPLADEVGCKRDAPVLKELGANVIRVYQTDSSKDHDACMKAFSDAGIYVALDLATPADSINRNSPRWDTGLFSAFRAKVDAFGKYDNVIAFIAGNEVANTVETTPSAAFVKAAIRDVKGYMQKSSLSIPVGYASNDEPEIRAELKAFFNCGDDAAARADFYGVNLYQWCGDMTFETSGYDAVTKEYEEYSIPVLLTEYGCNAVRPRKFEEARSLYGSDMDQVFSGGFAYMYTEEENEYGLVDVSYGKTAVTKLDDFANLQEVFADASPSGVQRASYSPAGGPETCPAASDNFRVSSDALPPTPSTQACQCMRDSLACDLDGSVGGKSGSEIDAFFADICDGIDCGQINYDTAKADYGFYQFCSLDDRVAWALDAYYADNGADSAKCGFDPFAGNVVSAPAESDQANCPGKPTDLDTASTNAGRQEADSGSTGSTANTSSANTAAALALAAWPLLAALHALS